VRFSGVVVRIAHSEGRLSENPAPEHYPAPAPPPPPLGLWGVLRGRLNQRRRTTVEFSGTARRVDSHCPVTIQLCGAEVVTRSGEAPEYSRYSLSLHELFSERRCRRVLSLSMAEEYWGRNTISEGIENSYATERYGLALADTCSLVSIDISPRSSGGINLSPVTDSKTRATGYTLPRPCSIAGPSTGRVRSGMYSSKVVRKIVS
jgi:hypothetical protein